MRTVTAFLSFGLRFAKRGLLVGSLLLVFACASMISRADDLASGFEAANKLYEESNYAAATAAYDKLLASGEVSESLYFNRGNSLFKQGQIGRAIASYRHARQLAPRDAELNTNLHIARARASGGNYHGDRWQSWLTTLTLNEWTTLTSASLWVLFVLLALGQWRKSLRERLRSCVRLAGMASLLFCVCLGFDIRLNYFTTSAIVVTGEAEVRNGPLDESQTIFKVRDGAELDVLDEKDGWFQVVDPNQRTGWLRQDQVITFAPNRVSRFKS